MNKRTSGFTIIEIIIVVAMIGILASITVFAFSNWRSRTARTEMKNEVAQAWAAAKNYRNYNGSYPTSQAAFNGVYTAGSSVTLTYVTTATGSDYCLKATSTNDTSVWYVSSVTSQPVSAAPTVPNVTCP